MAQSNAQANDKTNSQVDHDEQNHESGTSAAQAGTKKYSLDFWSCSLIMFLVELGCAILGAPSPRLLEMAVCRQYFERHDPKAVPSNGNIPESDCKNAQIQRSFTFMMTVLSTCTNLTALLMQMPMGALADKKGRRLALLLNITSTILYWDWIVIVGYLHHLFPTWCLYLAPAFIIVGGGPWATATLVFAAINDKVPPEQRAIAFSIMEAIAAIADLLGPIVGSLTMSHQLWIPFFIATICFFMMFIPTFLVAENARKVSLNTPARSSDSVAPESQPLLSENAACNRATGPTTLERNLLRSKAPIFATCFSSFFLIYASRGSVNFIIPWVSFRFEEPMARAGLLFSIRGVISLLLYLAIIPAVSTALSRKWKFGTATRDLTLSRWSVFLLSAGSFLVAFAPNVWALVAGFAITILGSSASITLRSFLAAGVNPAFSGRLYAAISTVATLGGLVGTPIMGAIYSWGISHEAWNVAPPFVVAGLCYLVIIGVLAYL